MLLMHFTFDLFFVANPKKTCKTKDHRPKDHREIPLIPRNESTSEFMPVDDKEVEYFFASDASAVIEHTNRVIYLEVNCRLTPFCQFDIDTLYLIPMINTSFRD